MRWGKLVGFSKTAFGGTPAHELEGRLGLAGWLRHIGQCPVLVLAGAGEIRIDRLPILQQCDPCPTSSRRRRHPMLRHGRPPFSKDQVPASRERSSEA